MWYWVIHIMGDIDNMGDMVNIVDLSNMGNIWDTGYICDIGDSDIWVIMVILVKYFSLTIWRRTIIFFFKLGQMELHSLAANIWLLTLEL